MSRIPAGVMRELSYGDTPETGDFISELLDKLEQLEESYVRTINRDGEYANELLAEVKRLKLKVNDIIECFVAPEYGDEWLDRLEEV